MTLLLNKTSKKEGCVWLNAERFLNNVKQQIKGALCKNEPQIYQSAAVSLVRDV